MHIWPMFASLVQVKLMKSTKTRENGWGGDRIFFKKLIGYKLRQQQRSNTYNISYQALLGKAQYHLVILIHTTINLS